MGLFVLVATGPNLSLADIRRLGIARAARDDITVIAINDAVYPCWFADIAYASDQRWWQYHKGLPRFAGLKLTAACLNDQGRNDNAVPFPDVQTYDRSGDSGVDDAPGRIRTGENSGYAAINVALKFDAKRLLLLGYDAREGGTHWFGSHPAGMRGAPNLKNWLYHYEALLPALKKRGVEIFIGSKETALTFYPYLSLEDALNA